MTRVFIPGSETWFASDSSTTSFSAVFEDDGATGYFYAYDRDNPGEPILDAMLIYSTADLIDKDRESEAQIIWSTDGVRAAFLLNRQPHAVIDFSSRCSYCRTGSSSAGKTWKRGTWTDELMKSFSAVH